MGDKLKAIKSKGYYVPITSNRTDGASLELDHHKFLSSNYTMEKELVCSDCKPKFVVPPKTTTYHSCECHCQVVCKSTSGYKQSRENCFGAKLFNQTQLHTASVIASGHSSPLSSTINNKRAVLCGVTYRYSGRRYRLKGTVNDVINMKHLLVEKFAFPIQSIRVLTGGITENEINSTIVVPLKRGVKLHAIIDACHSGTTLDLMHVYKKDNGNWKWMNNHTPSIKPSTECTNGGLAICFSACEESQMAADSTVFGGKEMNGVMTYLLTKII
ncbi:metacaspase-3-like [Trifolium pratense]|uniref:Uncharacterized protein n=1 Tax=Trifolium pratense TaxID=57577 RepID=A0ACB0JYN6_TRIPR|nr:metacaspase-3-like [Trifolium pratense]CAJ2648959.1 unnamed protein product [Trifolium pratense]